MTNLQIYLDAIYKMPWLLIIPVAIIWTGLVEAVNKKRDRRATR